MKHLIEMTFFIFSAMAMGETAVVDRYVRAIFDHDGSLIEKQGDGLLGIDVEQHLAHTTLTLVTQPNVFKAAPRCVMGWQRPEDMVVDYFLGTAAAVNGSSAPGKIVVRMNLKSLRDSRARFPVTVTCY